MTETEIMKATECCKSGDCVACPLSSNRYESKCKDILFEAVIDLINRKNAEIEQYQTDSETLAISLLNAKKEIERLEALSKHHQTLINMLNEGIAKARAEAIKEYVEKLKTEIKRRVGSYNCICISIMLDQIAKEMGVEL